MTCTPTATTPPSTAPESNCAATPRQPVQPSAGGLLGRSFIYRSAAQTDVRLTWQRATAQLKGHSHTQS